jgi:hypothetical protein
MKKPDRRQAKPGFEGAANTQRDFTGTDNPRHLRALAGLRRRPMPREELDSTAGCSNGPALVSDLRDMGLEIPCVKVPCLDRDGREVKRGIYHLNDTDRRKIASWLTRRDQNGGNHA